MPGPDKLDRPPRMYPDAGRNAPPEVQAAIERWERTVSLSSKLQLPLLYWLLGDGTPAYKMGKLESAYLAVSPIPGAVCGNCIFAYVQIATGRLICSQVRGDVAVEGWCKLWRAR